MAVLFGYRNYSTPPLLSYSLGLQSRLGPFLIVVLLAGAIVLAWRVRNAQASSRSFVLTVSFLLALTSITLLPGHAVYDHVILLPGILLIAFTWREIVPTSRTLVVVLAVTALALFWQWIVVLPLLGIRLLPSHTQPISATVGTLPFRAAASVPLGIFSVLGFLLRKAMRDKAALDKASIGQFNSEHTSSVKSLS
jgi:hypothetical protein